MDDMMTWKEGLEHTMKRNGETLSDIVSSTLTPEEMGRSFDGGYGGEEGLPFTVWTTDFVYFPVCYDGSEWVGSVARNPNGKPTPHQGGG
jgi:hypothetical protein